MAELKIKLSDKALSLIAQLQKEIFNRRRKKVTPSGVVETLVESAAKSQSDKRFATSWKNLVVDIEKPFRYQQQGFSTMWQNACLLYTSPSPRDATLSRMPSSA